MKWHQPHLVQWGISRQTSGYRVFRGYDRKYEESNQELFGGPL